MNLDVGDPALAAEVLDRASTVRIDDLPTLIGEAFHLIRKTIPLPKGDQKLIVAAKKSSLNELRQRASRPQGLRLHLERKSRNRF